MELDNEDKDKISNLKKYDEELEMLEYWLIDTRIYKYVFLMLYCSIGKEHIEGQNIKMSCEPVDNNKVSR